MNYPLPNKRKIRRQDMIRWGRWPFLLAACLCPVINLCVGGPAWGVIVLWSLWMVWSFLFSPDLVECNRISLLIKLITSTSVLLILIDGLLSPGWAIEVVPIVCFSGLAVSGALIFTDLERQKQNMLPMLLIALSIFCSLVGLLVWREESRWALAVMGALAVALLTACAVVLGNDFIRELKKRFHTR